MSQTQIEGQVLHMLEQSLQKALDRHGEYSQGDLDEIARQKLLVNAVRHFDEVEEFVTIGWFKDGDILTELDEYEEDTVITNAGVDGGPIPKEDELISYFLDSSEGLSIDEVLGMEDRKEWLESYYRSLDDMPFKEIYLNGMDIHLFIRRIMKLCNDGVPASEFPEDIAADIDESVMELKQELNRYPLFRNIPPYVTEFNRVATTILNNVESALTDSNTNPKELTSLLYQLNKFYFETCWDAIANRVEYYTAEGPSEDRVRAYRRGKLKVSKETFRVELDKLREECNRNDIKINPDIKRLPDLEDEYEDLSPLLDWNIQDSRDSGVTSD